MPPPDFVIVGSPKCGTTALHRYLQAHPGIFMPARKEPHFFGDDLPAFHRKYDDISDYQAIFDDATPDQLCGEASVLYMHSAIALDKLQAHNPEVKCIAVIRNPVDLFFSWHNQNYKRLDESYADPGAAWQAQDARARGEDIPEGCRHPELLVYRDFCALGSKLAHFMRDVPLERRYIVLYDDLVNDTAAVHSGILDFLGLDAIGDIAFERANKRVQPRSLALEKLLWNPPLGLAYLRKKLKPVLNKRGVYPSRFLRRLNNKPIKQQGDPALRQELVRQFEPEIARIEACMGRDLLHWRQ